MGKYVANKILRLQDPDPKVRRAAAEALGRLKRDKEEAVAPLIEALEDSVGEVSHAALRALVKIGEPAILPAINALQHQSATIRYNSISFFNYIRDERAVEPLINLLNTDESNNVRVAAAGVLSGLDGDNKRQIEALIKALKDPDSDIRANAAISLNLLRASEAKEALIEALKDENDEVRAQAAWALGNCGGDEVVEPLLLILDDKSESVRQCAVIALRWKSDDRVIDPIISKLKDESSKVRESAASALRTFPSVTGISQAIEPLLNTLKDEVSEVRYEAVETLGRIGGEESLVALEWLRDNDKGETYLRYKVSEAASNAIEYIKQRTSAITNLRQLIEQKVPEAVETKDAGLSLSTLSFQSSARTERHVWVGGPIDELAIDLKDRNIEGEGDNAVAKVTVGTAQEAVELIQTWLSGQNLDNYDSLNKEYERISKKFANS